MKLINLFFTLLSTIGFYSVSAQTVSVYAASGTLKGTYSTIAAAIAAASGGDSLLFSAHTFKEYNLSVLKPLIYQGTVSGKDTSTIDADGKPFCFSRCEGTIRDLVITGAKGAGCTIGIFNGKITGFTTIRNNGDSLSGSVIQIQSGAIEQNVRIINNRIGKAAPVAVFGTVRIGDNVIISGNRSDNWNALWLAAQPGNDSSNAKLTIEGNVRIENNRGGLNCIYLHNGSRFTMTGGCIANNATDSTDNGIIKAGNVNVFGIYRASVNINLKNVRIYNPLADGKRVKEVVMIKDSVSNSFFSEGCWWGNSDTSGLFSIHPFNTFTMPNYAVCKWAINNGTPVGSLSSWPVSGTLLYNVGGTFPSNNFSSATGIFMASSGGSFSPASVPISTANVVSSIYTKPLFGTVPIRAAIDADTFRGSSAGVGIIERGFEQVKIYPNPANNFVNIEGAEAGSCVTFYDIMGRTLKTDIINVSGNKTIDVSDLPTGNYVLKIATKEGAEGSAVIAKK